MSADPSVCLVHHPDTDITPWINCLQQGGYEVDSFDNLESAKSALNDGTFHALLAHIQLDQDTLTDLIQSARSLHPHLPILAFSDQASTEQIIHAFKVQENC